MLDFKKDFPIFEKNLGLVYFDNTATSQKPKYVIDKIVDFYSKCNSNIHRGAYGISQEAEELYESSKEIIAKNLNAESKGEIIFTYNSTYASNIFISSLKTSGKLKKGDKVLVTIAEHHANIVPWLILKEEIGIEVDYINITENFDLDLEDFKKKYDDRVKVVSLTYVSNVLGSIFDLEAISKLLRKDTLFVVDGSQSVPHFNTDVKKLNCDVLFFTGHKVLAELGIGVLYIKKELLKELKPTFGGGGSIAWVKKGSFKEAVYTAKFEPGTPNVGGAVSLLGAFEYIEKIGGYETIEKVENELTEYMLKKFGEFPEVKLVGKKNPENRVGVFTFYVDGIHANDLSDVLAEDNVCVRAGKHCAEPLIDETGQASTARASIYFYNTKDDIDKFFISLKKAINILK